MDIEQEEKFFEVGKDDINLATYATRNNGLEDITYLDNVSSVEINMDREGQSWKIETQDGSNIVIEGEIMDSEVENLAGNIQINTSYKTGENKLWKTQKILTGVSGDDIIRLEGRDYSETTLLRETEINATSGSDKYIGSQEIEKISYRDVGEDILTGLYITNTEEEITMIADNMPPLMIDSITKDELIVYKNYQDLITKDSLENIDIIRTTNYDDNIVIVNDTNTIFNLLGGSDKAVIIGNTLENVIDKVNNVEKIEWQKTNIEDGIMVSTGEKYEFQVEAIREDQNSRIFIDNELKEITGESEELIIMYFNNQYENNLDLKDWVSLNRVAASPEEIGQGKIVIYTEIKRDTDSENKEWLEIHAKDLREDGKGLIGLDLDIEWNSNKYQIDKENFNKNKIFENNQLPLFQDIGIISENKGRMSLRSITSAALPRANTGVALGNNADPIPQTLFARIPLLKIQDGISGEINIVVNSFPTAAGRKAEIGDLKILNDPERKDKWVLDVMPQQKHVGKHIISIESKDNNEKRKNIILDVVNENDKPRKVEEEKLEKKDLNITAKEGEEVRHELTKLFFDEDGEKLDLDIVDGPAWLRIDKYNQILIGIPPSDSEGNERIKIKASDLDGNSVVRELKIEIENTNQIPQIGTKIEIPLIKQDEIFIYRMPETAFIDQDINERVKDILTYDIIDRGEQNSVPEWLNIDRKNGTISGQPSNSDVGEHIFIVRATDREGAYVDQEVRVLVENVNDSPVQTEKLNRFEDDQIRIYNEGSADSNDSQAIYINEEKDLDLREWFTDPDMLIDETEEITFKVYLENDNGSQSQIDNDYLGNSSGWLKYDKNQKLLKILANGEHIGKHYIKVSAEDRVGEKVSATIPVVINWKNQIPVVNTTNIVEKIESQGIGIKKAEYQLDQGMRIELQENKDIEFKIPKDLFQDQDLAINPDEELNIELVNLSGNNHSLIYDREELKVYIDTRGEGVDSPQGYMEWGTKLTATDKAGEIAEIEVLFCLQREVKSAEVKLTMQKGKIYDEGDKVTIDKIVDIDFQDYPDHTINLAIRHRAKSNQVLNLIEEGVFELEPILSSEGLYEWRISGNIEEIKDRIQKITLETADNADLTESYEIELLIYTQLGQTGMKSEIKKIETELKYEAVASTPIWEENDSYIPSSGYEMLEIGKNLKAVVSDKSEILTYEVTIKEPSTNEEFFISDRTGRRLGFMDDGKWILNEKEWENAIIRDRNGAIDVISIEIQALSREPTNGRVALSEVKEVDWVATPIIEGEVQANFEISDIYQIAGRRTSIECILKIPKSTKTALIQLTLPKGSKVYSEESIISREEKNNIEDVFEWEVNIEELNGEFKSLDVEIETDELYSGKYKGEYQILASTRKNISSQESSARELDKVNLIAKNSDSNQFEMVIYQIAKEPEINISSKNETLSFDPINQKLLIPFRRGQSSSGNRNKNEELMIALSNIPDGYTIAENKGGKYISIGATDAFGTTILFSIPKSNKTLEQLDEYELLNDGNLFLVSTNEFAKTIEKNHSISTAITASIDGGSGLNTRSKTITEEIVIKDMNYNDPKYLNKDAVFVDPVVIDLSGTGMLQLTNLETDDGNVKFEMIPGKGKINTAWIDASDKQAGFIVLNNQSNDSEDDLIKSSKELFSEYFRTQDNGRSFSSGSSALRTLDNNKDGKLDNSDVIWKELEIWIDNGDGVSQANEMYSISDYVDEINIENIKTLQTNPEWANGNNVIREIVGYRDGKEVKLYDIGFQVAFNDPPLLEIEHTRVVSMNEDGEVGRIQFSSKDSENWIMSGKDKLTLVRVGGLPEEIIPSLGVKDSRGDWLFTWSDLKKNEGVLELVSENNFSGEFNLQLMISQVQENGTMISSSINSVGVSIKGIADKPILQLNNQEIEEDGVISIQDIVEAVRLRDTDGSEVLSLSFSNIPEELNLVKKVNQGNNEYEIIRKDREFELAEINDLAIMPVENVSGNFEINIHAITREIKNDSKEETVEKANIYIVAKADQPKRLEVNTDYQALEQDGTIDLKEFIKSKDIKNILLDNDGSEELRIKLNVPNEVHIYNRDRSDWMPIKIERNSSKMTSYVFEYTDLNSLSLKDNGIRDKEISITANTLSREISTGEIGLGEALEIKIPFMRDAIQPSIEIKEARVIDEDEDEDDYGWLLSEILDVIKENENDQTFVQIHNLPEDIELVSTIGKEIDKSSIDIDELSNILLKPKENKSGDIALEFRAISYPNSGGKSAQTNIREISLFIRPVADEPKLVLMEGSNQITINQNGWLDIGNAIESMESQDKDGSEQLFLLLSSKNEKGDTIPLPTNSRLSALSGIHKDSYWEVGKEECSNLKLYLGIIENEIILELGIRSKDSHSIKDGNSFTLRVPSNNILRAPIIDISNDLNGNEDEYIPLMQEQGGILDAELRDPGMGKTLSIKLNEIEEGITLVKKLINTEGNPEYSAALNKVNQETGKSELELEYSEWNNIYIKGPDNGFGIYQLTAQAFARLGDKEKKGNPQQVNVNIKSINDVPSIIDSGDLSSIDEGDLGRWNLKERFYDVDNLSEQLSIGVKVVLDDGTRIELPDWLILDENGVLTGKPTNNDVANLELEVTATDPGGQQAKLKMQLSVNNTNNPPTINDDYSGFENWQSTISEGKIIYQKNILLRDSISIRLANDNSQTNEPNGLFSDPDSIHEDQDLEFSISDKNLTVWSNEITGVAEIEEGILKISVTSKDFIGEQVIFVKSTDNEGASTIQELRLNIININDPPEVNRENAILVGEQLWEELVELKQDEENWIFNTQSIFKDNDPGEILAISEPRELPNWITVDENGILSGIPRNKDVGQYTLTWRAMDEEGKSAYFRLKVNVENINKGPNFTGQISKIQGYEDKYKKIDLNQLFTDEDKIHGDSLDFKLKVLNSDNELTDTPDWIKINYVSNESTQIEDRFILSPRLYRVENNEVGEKELSAEELSQLEENTRLGIKINAKDLRNLELKGLVGIDLDISLNNNLIILEDTININSGLPLFNQVVMTENGMRLTAGSAPDALNIGKAIGIGEDDYIASFIVMMKDPEKSIDVTITPGQGDLRDGILDRYGDRLDEDNTIINQYSTRASALLDILSPPNKAVGDYQIEIMAEDNSGLSSQAIIPIEIKNTNDKPYLNDIGHDKLKVLFKSFNSKDKALREGEKISLPYTKVFSDDDTLLGDIVNEKLEIRLVSQNGDPIKDIEIDTSASGDIQLDIGAPKGISSYIKHVFKLEASDQMGEYASTDWFTAFVKPAAQLVNLTSGKSQSNIASVESYFEVNKNVEFNIARTLELNSIELPDPEGDDAYMIISVPYTNAQIRLNNEINGEIIGKIITGEESRFRISLNRLQNQAGTESVDLSGLKLILPENEMMLIPNNLSTRQIAGIPLRIWTEARVSGDEQNQIFETAETAPVTIWIKLNNKTPIFNSPNLIILDNTQELQNTVLLSLKDLFIDLDKNDLKVIDVMPDEKIKDYIKLNKDTYELSITSTNNTNQKLPDGLHKIGVRMKDSSGIIGDRSGFASGQIKLLIKSTEDQEQTSLGLNLLATIDNTNVARILSNSNDKLDKSQKQLKSILQELKVIQQVESEDSFTANDIKEAQEFISKIQKGSAAILENDDLKSKDLIVLQTENDDNVLISSELNIANSEVLNKSQTLLEVSSGTRIEAPIGELDFTIDTQGRENAVVNIQLPDDINITSLVKTRYNGDLFKFNAQEIKYNENFGDIETWMSQLEYRIYDYSVTEESTPVVLNLSPERSIREDLLNSGFDINLINNLDGSAYLIDTDNDGKANILSMMLLDQGWFDTRDEIGLIGDPLTPIEFNTEEITNLDAPFNPSRVELNNSNALVNLSQMGFMYDQNINKRKAILAVDATAYSSSFNKMSSSHNSAAVPTNNELTRPEDYSSSNLILERGTDSGALRGIFKSWEEAGRKFLQRSLESVLVDTFDRKLETSISPLVVMLVLGIGVERLSQGSLKSINLSKSLKLLRREDNNEGNWIIPSRNQKTVEIRFKDAVVSVNKTDKYLDYYGNPKNLIPGFDKDGSSWLYNSLQQSICVGELIADIEKKFYQIESKTGIDIDWISWINQYFTKEAAKQSLIRFKHEHTHIFRLKKLINKYQSSEPAMADVVMLGQLYDCCDQLGIHRINSITNRYKKLDK